MGLLDGRVAVVTGAGRGIGREFALSMAREGAHIVINDVGVSLDGQSTDEDPAAQTVADIKALGVGAIASYGSVTDYDDAGATIQAAIAEFGRIDILVNNAATNPVFGPVANLDERAWDAIMNTNVKSAFFLSKMVRDAIREHGEGGSIINVSSTGGLRASGGLGGYSVSKAALIMLTQVCAKEWGSDGIRVNAIAPGLIKTEFSRALWENEAILKNSLTQSPLRRIGDPDEMAGAVVYFASAASSFTTGQTLALDGGGLA